MGNTKTINVMAAGVDCQVVFDNLNKTIAVFRYFNSESELAMVLDSDLNIKTVQQQKGEFVVRKWDYDSSNPSNADHFVNPMLLAVDYALSHPAAKGIDWISEDDKINFPEKYNYNPYVISEHAVKIGNREFAKVMVTAQAYSAIVKIRDEQNNRTLVCEFLDWMQSGRELEPFSVSAENDDGSVIALWYSTDRPRRPATEVPEMQQALKALLKVTGDRKHGDLGSVARTKITAWARGASVDLSQFQGRE